VTPRVGKESVQACAAKREIPSLAILAWRVGLFISSRVAALGTRNDPIRLFKGIDYLLTFCILQDLVEQAVGRFGARRLFYRKAGFRKLHIPRVDFEIRACRNNNSAFDHLLQFANITRPLIFGENLSTSIRIVSIPSFIRLAAKEVCEFQTVSIGRFNHSTRTM
jgi:hypothetical protein